MHVKRPNIHVHQVNRSQLFDSEIEEMRNIFMAHSADSRQEVSFFFFLFCLFGQQFHGP
jgi:hypothetical protein